MSSKYDFPKVPKRKGTTKRFVPIYVEAEFKIALERFAERQSVIAGHHVSTTNVVQTAMSQRYPEQIGYEYRRLKKEGSDEEKKFMDIKR
ncbi:hypothetical protein [Streptomyces sp. BBFR109]|uniref:hypothetical protein n=1 Tax=Streptomyces sp. BBFR109 TaxID=3448172 RepID=UPI003F76EA75